ncbi:MAG: 3-oxoacyl-ACP synthase III family protein [Halobacteriota archaeon]
MYINGIASYFPEEVIRNDYFFTHCGVSPDWIEDRCGIQERRRCNVTEDANTMGANAVKELLKNIAVPNFDMIVGATYTPADTVVTLAHSIQHQLDLPDIPTLNVMTACSSVLNALEIVECYFYANKATHALVVGSEHNSGYLDESDPQSAPLWGDGAVAFDVTKFRSEDRCLEVKCLRTGGAATVGKATNAVYLRPRGKGIPMVHGADVFVNACSYMEREAISTLQKARLSLSDISYLIPHQANKRISKRLQRSLGLPDEKIISNVERYGNTGCCGFGIGLAETLPMIKSNDHVLVVVFGGGYSFGSMLLTMM